MSMEDFPIHDFVYYYITLAGVSLCILGGIFVINGNSSELIGALIVAGLVVAFAGASLMIHEGVHISS